MDEKVFKAAEIDSEPQISQGVSIEEILHLATAMLKIIRAGSNIGSGYLDEDDGVVDLCVDFNKHEQNVIFKMTREIEAQKNA